MPTKRKTGKRVTVKNVDHPEKTAQVDATMYEAMRRAMLKVLPTREPGSTLAEMRSALQLPKELFPGGAGESWWAKTVQLDLEAKGVLVREKSTPIRLHRRK